MAVFVLYSFCSVLRLEAGGHLQEDVDGVGGEAAVRQVQHPHAGGPEVRVA